MANNIYELSQDDVLAMRNNALDGFFDQYKSAISVKVKEMDRKVSDKCIDIAAKYEIYVDERMLIEMLTQDKNRYRQAYRDGYAKGVEMAVKHFLEMIAEPDYE